MVQHRRFSQDIFKLLKFVVTVFCSSSMVRRETNYVVSHKNRLGLPGLSKLAPEFSLVVEGGEYQPPGSIEPLWQKRNHASVTNQAFLRVLASRILPCSIPARSGIVHGDPLIFQRPPVLDSSRAKASSAVCLLFSSARSDGFYCQGRYRQLLLGFDKDGKRVIIGAHRLICWIVNGPVRQGRKRKVTCHHIKGCPMTGACANPLHLRCAEYWDV